MEINNIKHRNDQLISGEKIKGYCSYILYSNFEISQSRKIKFYIIILSIRKNSFIFKPPSYDYCMHKNIILLLIIQLF